MRVNTNILYNQIVDSIAKKNKEIYEAHEKLTTLKKVNRPSDDVTSYFKASNYKLKLSNIDQFKRNVNYANGSLSFVETQLNDLNDSIDRVIELMTLGLNATEDSVSRNAIAQELRHISDFVLGIANKSYEGNYIFAGFKTDQKPFPSINSLYSGDSGHINVSLDGVSFISINITGDKLFSFNDFASTSLVTPDNKYIYYNPQVDGSLKIEIRDTDNTTVLKTIDVANVMDGIYKLSEAVGKNDLISARALTEVISYAKNKVEIAQTEVGTKLARLEKQTETLDEFDFIYKKLLSDVEDADVTLVASQIASIQASLEALRLSAAKIFSQSLLDFLR
jgi:flagellar hook-associated protein 3 FlgL